MTAGLLVAVGCLGGVMVAARDMTAGRRRGTGAAAGGRGGGAAAAVRRRGELIRGGSSRALRDLVVAPTKSA